MTFVCTVSQETVSIDVFRRGNAIISVANVGYDDSSTRGYSVAVGLEPQAGGELEFFFHLIETDSETDYEFIYWCGKDTSSFIGKDDRKFILDTILAMTRELLDASQPQKVHYCTHDQNPPDRALVKHFLIAAVFEHCGYEVHVADEYHGKRVWWMQRV